MGKSLSLGLKCVVWRHTTHFKPKLKLAFSTETEFQLSPTEFQLSAHQTQPAFPF